MNIYLYVSYKNFHYNGFVSFVNIIYSFITLNFDLCIIVLVNIFITKLAIFCQPNSLNVLIILVGGHAKFQN